MKVKTLIGILKEHNQEEEVVLSRDPEGNGFSTLEVIASGLYSDGDLYDIKDRDKEEVPKDAERVTVLWP